MDEKNSSFSIADLKSAKQKELYQYWLDLKGENNYPLKNEFKPMDIARVLSSIFLVDVFYDPVRFQARLIGTESIERLGIDGKGLWLHDLPKSRALAERLEWVVKNGKPYYTVDKMAWADKSFVNYSALVLPMSSDGDHVDYLLSSLHYF